MKAEVQTLRFEATRSKNGRRRAIKADLRPLTEVDKLDQAERLVRFAVRLWECKNAV